MIFIQMCNGQLRYSRLFSRCPPILGWEMFRSEVVCWRSGHACSPKYTALSRRLQELPRGVLHLCQRSVIWSGPSIKSLPTDTARIRAIAVLFRPFGPWPIAGASVAELKMIQDDGHCDRLLNLLLVALDVPLWKMACHFTIRSLCCRRARCSALAARWPRAQGSSFPSQGALCFIHGQPPELIYLLSKRKASINALGFIWFRFVFPHCILRL